MAHTPTLRKLQKGGQKKTVLSDDLLRQIQQYNNPGRGDMRTYFAPQLPPSKEKVELMEQKRQAELSRPKATIQKARPRQSTASKAWEVLTHPATAFSYAVKGQDLPDYFSSNPNGLDPKKYKVVATGDMAPLNNYGIKSTELVNAMPAHLRDRYKNGLKMFEDAMNDYRKISREYEASGFNQDLMTPLSEAHRKAEQLKSQLKQFQQFVRQEDPSFDQRFVDAMNEKINTVNQKFGAGLKPAQISQGWYGNYEIPQFFIYKKNPTLSGRIQDFRARVGLDPMNVNVTGTLKNELKDQLQQIKQRFAKPQPQAGGNGLNGENMFRYEPGADLDIDPGIQLHEVPPPPTEVNTVMQRGGIVVDPDGYNPGSKSKDEPAVVIPSGDITMKKVKFPILGIDELGNAQIMLPGAHYSFPGQRVLEIPLKKAQSGTQVKTAYPEGYDPNKPWKVVSQTSYDSYDPTGAAVAVGAMSFFGRALEAQEENRIEEWNKRRMMNSGPVVAGSRGDYTVNEGYIRPDQHTPVQFRAIPMAAKGGEMFVDPMTAPSIPMPMVPNIPSFDLGAATAEPVNVEGNTDLRSAGKAGDVATRTNNPGNMKWHGWMKQFGGYDSGIEGKDGGTFAAFPTVEAGLKAYEMQLFGDVDGVFKSRYYKSGTPVDKALKTWSNNGYGAEIYPEIKGKTLGQLTPAERQELIKRQIKRESGRMYNMLEQAGIFQQGGEYTVSAEQLQQILANGGEVEFL